MDENHSDRPRAWVPPRGRHTAARPRPLAKWCSVCLDPLDPSEAAVEADPASPVVGMDVHRECSLSTNE